MSSFYGIRYVSPLGVEFDLFDPHSEIVIREDGFNGLVGNFADVAVSAVGVPGQQFVGLNIEKMEGSLKFFAVQQSEDRPWGVAFAEFKEAFSHRTPGTLIVESPSLGQLECRVRLAGSVHALPLDPNWSTGLSEFELPLVCDDGFWRTKVINGHSGSVTVTNAGDVDIWPMVRWRGAGGRVTLPSGADFELPEARDYRTLFLNNAQSCVVVDDDGTVDRELWRALNGSVLPEGIPVGAIRTYQLPAGAELQWRLGFFDPFKR